MDAKEANMASMAFHLKGLKEAIRASQLAQRKADIKSAVAAHKTIGAKRMVRIFIYFCFFATRYL